MDEGPKEVPTYLGVWGVSLSSALWNAEKLPQDKPGQGSGKPEHGTGLEGWGVRGPTKGAN